MKISSCIKRNVRKAESYLDEKELFVEINKLKKDIQRLIMQTENTEAYILLKKALKNTIEAATKVGISLNQQGRMRRVRNLSPISRF